MAVIRGMLPKNSITNPVGDITGHASGSVSWPVSIEDALRELIDDAPPAVVPKAATVPLEANPTQYRVHIVGETGDQYLSNGDFVCTIPRNKEVVVAAHVLEVLKQSQGVEFTYLPA